MDVSLSESVKSVLQAAGQTAARFRHLHVTVDHLLYVLLAEQSAAAILTRCGCDIGHLEHELAEYLELLPEQSSRAVHNPPFDAALERVATRAALHCLSSGRSAIAATDLLAPILREPDTYAAMLLGAEGLTRLELLRCVSHGSPNPSLYRGDALPPGPLVQLLLHNDHYTSMEFVKHVLDVVFGYSEQDATTLMLQVHQTGSAKVGHYELTKALAKTEQLRALAAENEFPLLCTIERFQSAAG